MSSLRGSVPLEGRPIDAPHFPGADWETREPGDLGFDEAKLTAARDRLAEKAGRDGPFDGAQGRPASQSRGLRGRGKHMPSGGRYRVLIVRGGYIAAEWSAGVDADAHVGQASASKSVFSCLLGVAVDEGRIPSADARVSDYYPEMLDVPEGSGPKPGRASKPEDAHITFRQLITNTSGYLKPGELPGEVFHYQTWGMNVLMHALGRIYGLYDVSDPESSAGPGELIREKIRDPIGGSWSWEWRNFEHPPGAKLGVFGYATVLRMTARDQARLGWLWRNEGSWAGRPLVPAEWMRQATVAAPSVRRHAPSEQWCYGHGFWTNDCGKLWPSLPRDSFAASGAGGQHIWVCPALDLVVCQSPGVWTDQAENDSGLLRWVLDALR